MVPPEIDVRSRLGRRHQWFVFGNIPPNTLISRMLSNFVSFTGPCQPMNELAKRLHTLNGFIDNTPE
jgi:hypothetical protein